MDSNSIPFGMDFSEETLERFIRGEGELNFRSDFRIVSDSLRLRGSESEEESSKASRFLEIRGVATTSDTDANGVSVIPKALRSLPSDFKKRSTLLFNHDLQSPIGKVGKSSYIEDDSGEQSHVEVVALVSTEARSPEVGLRFVDLIEDGILSKFSFAWSTRDGEVTYDLSEKTSTFDEETETYRFKFGLDYAPTITVKKLTAVELSVVSVPADAGAEFSVKNLQRNLSSVVNRFRFDPKSNLLIPAKDIVRSSENVPTIVEDEVISPDTVHVEEEKTTAPDLSTQWDQIEQDINAFRPATSDEFN